MTFVTTRSRPESFRRSVRREDREVRPRKRDSLVEPLAEAEAAEADEGVMEEERVDMRVKARTLLVKERGKRGMDDQHCAAAVPIVAHHGLF